MIVVYFIVAMRSVILAVIVDALVMVMLIVVMIEHGTVLDLVRLGMI